MTTGILIDFSGSMKGLLMEREGRKQLNNEENVTRGEAVIDTLFSVVQNAQNDSKSNDSKEDEKTTDRFFALGFGVNSENCSNNKHCDLFSLFDFVGSKYHTRDGCIALLQKYGIVSNADKYMHRIETVQVKQKHNVWETNYNNNNVRTANVKNNEDKVVNIDLYTIDGYEPLIEMASKNGAPCAGEYIRKHLSEEEAGYIFVHFDKHKDLLNKMVNELPEACKSQQAYDSYQLKKKGYIGATLFGGLIADAIRVAARISGGTTPPPVVAVVNGEAENTEAEKAIARARSLISSPMYDIVKKPRSRKQVLEIIDHLSLKYASYKRNNSSNNNNNNKNSRLDTDKIIKDTEKYIYGNSTPMYDSLFYANKIFEANPTNNNSNNDDHERILLIISDGLPNVHTPNEVISFVNNKLKNEKNVTIISCFLTNDNIACPKTLYGNDFNNNNQIGNNKLKGGALLMYEIASYVENNNRAISILRNHGWTISQKSSKSKLFIQANHPNVIKQFCDVINHLANKPMHNETFDAIADLIGDYNFEKIINNKISSTTAPHQVGGTCYANAVAGVFHLAMSRIKGRQDGIPSFETLKTKFIAKYGCDGANTENVIKENCSNYRLHYKETKSEAVARGVIEKRRPMVARFRLEYKTQWDKFSKFFKNNKKGILTRNDVEMDKEVTEEEKKGSGGHAVILVRCESNCLVFMNSWGAGFADEGFFRVKNAEVLGFTFFDVYWTLNDLTEDEKEFYKDYCKNMTKNAVNDGLNYVTNGNGDAIAKSIKDNVNYQCAKCQQASKLAEYNGNFLKVICPKCGETFSPTVAGFVKGLYWNQMSQD